MLKVRLCSKDTFLVIDRHSFFFNHNLKSLRYIHVFHYKILIPKENYFFLFDNIKQYAIIFLFSINIIFQNLKNNKLFSSVYSFKYAAVFACCIYLCVLSVVSTIIYLCFFSEKYFS